MSSTPTTKTRLVYAASLLFASKGFRDTTVAEICEKADANIAAVNYHFGDKESLYDAVWHLAFEVASTTYPIDGGLPENPTLEDVLYSYANALLHRIFSEDDAGIFAKLLHQEMSKPTLALDRIADEVLFPQNQFLIHKVHAELGPSATQEDVRLCVRSIIGQCAFFNFSRPLRERILGKNDMSEQGIQQIAHHIARFSMGGLNGVRP